MATTDEGTSTVAGDDASESKRGWAEASECSVCGAEVSKRKFNPRHHCRICGNTVCGACSPSTVKLEGEKALQRACTPCVWNAQIAPSIQERLVHLVRNLHAIGGSDAPSNAPQNLDGSVQQCEAIVTSLEDIRDNREALKTQMQGMRMKLEKESERARRAEEDIEACIAEKQNLAQQLQAEQDRVQKAQDAISRGVEEQQRLERDLRGAVARASKAEKDADEQRQVRQRVEQNLQQESSRACKAEEDVERISRERQRLEHELHVESERASKAEEDITTRVQEQQRLEADLQNESKRAKHAEEEMSKQAQALQLVEDQLQRESTRAMQAEDQVKRSTDERQNLEQKLQVTLDRASTAEEDIATGRQEQQRLQDHLQSETIRANKAEEEASEQLQQRQRIEQALQHESSRMVQAEEEIKALNVQKQKQLQTIEMAESQYQALKDRATSFDLEKETLQKKLDDALANCRSANAKCSELTSRLTKVDMQCQSQAADLALAQKSLEELRTTGRTDEALVSTQAELREERQKRRRLEETLLEAQETGKQLGERLHELAGCSVSTASVSSLAAAMDICSSAVPHLEQVSRQLEDAKTTVQCKEVDLSHERQLRLAAEERLLAASTVATPHCPDESNSRIGIARTESLLNPEVVRRQNCADRFRCRTM